MKKAIFAVAVLLIAANSNAAVKVLGQGETRRFDTSGFPPAMMANYEIMKTKCTRCHSLERVVAAITEGVSPISGQPFDRNAVKAYGAKMMRQSSSRMSRPEIVATMELMNYLLDQAAR